MSTPHDKPSERADLSGRQLGNFRLLRRLGQGAMAEVYLAEQCSLQRQVAIKVLRHELADDQTYIRRFQREAQAAASLVHANIVQIHEVGCIGGVHFIVQEYVQGQNLRQWITRNGLPDLPHSLNIMRQVASALAKAADEGIVHRDIKPENIMITRSGEIKVADFGLARLARNDSKVDITQVGMTMGTPLYMSPEQIQGKPTDPRSDIYSLGVTCYHMLTGSPPFNGDTALALAVQHLKTEPEPLEKTRTDLPKDLCRVVHKMLAKDRDQRHLTPWELLQDLRQIEIEELGSHWPSELPNWQTAATGVGATIPVAATQKLQTLMNATVSDQPLRGHRLSWVFAILLCFLLGSSVAWFSLRRPALLAASSSERHPVPRQESAEKQLFYAMWHGTEEGWKAVIDEFPERKDYRCRSLQQLARIYLREAKYPEALDAFDKLASLGETEREFRAFGLAGKCAVFTLQGKYRESARTVDELHPLSGELKDTQMKRLLEQAIRKNRAELGPQTSREWQKWLEEQFPSAN